MQLQLSVNSKLWRRKVHTNLLHERRLKLKAYITFTDSLMSVLVSALVIKSLYYVNGSMHSCQIHPHSIPTTFIPIPADSAGLSPSPFPWTPLLQITTCKMTLNCVKERRAYQWLVTFIHHHYIDNISISSVAGDYEPSWCTECEA